VADPAQCRRHAQKCVRFAQQARSAQERRALLRLAHTWSSLAAQTEAYEAIVCKFIARGGETPAMNPKLLRSKNVVASALAALLA
jgi:hypothetical protein